MSLSIITTCRVDNYEGDSVGRFIESLEFNKKALDGAKINFEYIIVEWNPQNTYLSNFERTKHLFEDDRFKNIIVDKSVVKNEHLPDEKFIEYYAKNVGARYAKYDNILIINSDIQLSNDMCFTLSVLLRNELENKFYRARYRYNKYNGHIENCQDLYETNLPDGHLCAGFSGDFLMIKKVLFPGYDEVNPDHRLGRQTHMDGEILWQLDKSGIHLELLNDPYFHLSHGKSTGYQSGGYNTNGYENKSDWGFIKYPTKQDGKAIVIYSN